MAGPLPRGEVASGRASRTESGQRYAAGIYGAIVTAAVLEAAGGVISTRLLLVVVVVTLFAYWIAEEYAAILGKIAAGGVMTRSHVVAVLTSTWPMVSVSFAPLAAVGVAALAGASAVVAANVGLVVAAGLLAGYGWRASEAAGLRGWRLLASTSVAAAVGIGLILVKNLLLKELY